MYDGLPARLNRLSRRLLDPARALRDASGLFAPARALFTGPPAGTLHALREFGTNPGALDALLYVPPAPPRPGAALLVLLHGCGQDAGAFALACGFMALADGIGAPLLLPEQRADNNPGRCFNWFEPQKIRRGLGEAASIRQMVDAVRRRHATERTFVAGLSAGGAMAAALLAAYPDVFAAGAVVAGLPVGVASDVGSALARMHAAGTEPREVLAERAGALRWPHWPRLSVWHGGADHTVDPANADALVAQWTALAGLPAAPDAEAFPVAGVRRRGWGEAVEQWSLAGFGHAYPALLPGADPFVAAAPVSATAAIARFWGLARG